MSQTILIKNAQIVNEGKVFKGDVRIENQRFSAIEENITAYYLV